MNLKNKRPIFVPDQYQDEIEKFSKATLMDMLWDMAKQLTPPDDDGHQAPDSDVIGIVRSTGEVVALYRKREAKSNLDIQPRGSNK